KAAVAIEIGSEGGAEGDAVIGSGGLDEDVVNDAGGEDFAVGFGVERDAAGEAEIARAGFFESEADDAEHGGFAGVLNGECNVFVAIVDFGFGSAGRAEAGNDGSEASAVAQEMLGVDTVRIGRGVDEETEVHAGFAVGSEAHDLPLIAEGNEAEILGEDGVEESEGIGPVDGEERFEAAVAAVPEGSGFPGAAAVE